MDLAVLTIKQPKVLRWAPKADISAYEIALCLPLFGIRDAMLAEQAHERLPEPAKRHIIVVDPASPDVT